MEVSFNYFSVQQMILFVSGTETEAIKPKHEHKMYLFFPGSEIKVVKQANFLDCDGGQTFFFVALRIRPSLGDIHIC